MHKNRGVWVSGFGLGPTRGWELSYPLLNRLAHLGTSKTPPRWKRLWYRIRYGHKWVEIVAAKRIASDFVGVPTMPEWNRRLRTRP